ncbi:hypothetical protein E1B28_010247 [Marasmius oreades]|uniref:Uncharacterized protein n=1 Tax=Marasmius oreades TaxID=181124 RepID=A0A9P7RWR8_9AGAR|nr:uncharacterized protein E1B28_010247 [Marasmius oreades]KAG7091196.1 hypothetical protein E1B28_010247 [Marasmius oreades]
MATVYGRYSRDSIHLHSNRLQPPSPIGTAENIKLCMDLVIDLTALNVDFDYSCLEGLDDQLVLRPFEAFADICYECAVYDLFLDEETFAPLHHADDCQVGSPEADGALLDSDPASPETDSDGASLNTQGSDVYTFDSRSKVDFEVVKLQRPPQKLSLVQLHHLIHINDDGESFLAFRENCLKMNGLISEEEPVNSFPTTEKRKRTFGVHIQTTFRPSRQPF